MHLIINYILAFFLYVNLIFFSRYIKCLERRYVVFIYFIYFKNTLNFVIEITRYDNAKFVYIYSF